MRTRSWKGTPCNDNFKAYIKALLILKLIWYKITSFKTHEPSFIQQRPLARGLLASAFLLLSNATKRENFHLLTDGSIVSLDAFSLEP